MDLSHLNKPQREAVLTTEGPLLVLAGAGSGKTRVITHRICHLLDKRVPARAILAVTFTNKAASEMKERVVQMAGQRALGVTLSTFHAFGAEVLKEHLSKLGWPRKFAIVDTGDQIALVRRAMKERQIDDKVFDARKVLTLISRAKSAGIEPQAKPEGVEGEDIELVAHLVFPLYQLALKAQGAVDFDDLIVFPSRIFEKHPEVKEQFAKRFRYIMVDEYQDTNKAQLDLLRHLGDSHLNVCVVGDDDQCIYSWRGAEVRNILDFERLFPGGKEVRLEQNYRSNQVILDAANSVIEKNPDRRAKRMWSEVKGGPRITLCCAPSEEDEARWVASEVKRAIVEGISQDEVAILYRVNGQSRFLEEFLREREVRYEVIGGSEFFDLREVKDVIAYFRVIANPKDEISLLRIVNTPARGIGDVTMERLTGWALEQKVHLFEAMRRSAEVETLPKGAAEKLGEFVALIERYRKAFNRSGAGAASAAPNSSGAKRRTGQGEATRNPGNLSVLTCELLAEIQFIDNARASAPTLAAGDRKAKAVAHVIHSLEVYEKREGKKASLLTYLNRLSLDTKSDEEEPHHQAGRVTLMTLHGSKGLEWKLVFMVGVEEDLLPHSGMQGELPNPEEERRLCYVGMTRARDRLVMTRASTRIKRGKEMPRTPSRFLADIPEQLCDLVELAAVRVGPPTVKEQGFFASLRDKLKPPAPPEPARGQQAAVPGGSGLDSQSTDR